MHILYYIILYNWGRTCVGCAHLLDIAPRLYIAYKCMQKENTTLYKFANNSRIHTTKKKPERKFIRIIIFSKYYT